MELDNTCVSHFVQLQNPFILNGDEIWFENVVCKRIDIKNVNESASENVHYTYLIIPNISILVPKITCTMLFITDRSIVALLKLSLYI